MGYDLTYIRTRVAARLSRGGNSHWLQPGDQAELLAYINQAGNQICNMIGDVYWKHRSTNIVTVANTATVLLPVLFADWVGQPKLTTGGRRQLIWKPKPEFRRLPASGGAPTHYTQWAYDPTTGQRTLALWPTPDAVYTYEVPVVVKWVDLAAATDVPVIPQGFTHVLIDAAIAIGLKYEPDAGVRQAHAMDLRTELMAEMFRDKNRNAARTQRVVPPGSWRDTVSAPLLPIRRRDQFQ